MKHGELTVEEVAKLIRIIGGMPEVRRLLLGEPIAKEQERQSFLVKVDCDLSLAEMIAAGNYGWVNHDITLPRFPIQKTGKKRTEVALFHFNRALSSVVVVGLMERVGFCPACIEHLLALGAAHPELQMEHPIAALGSVWLTSVGRRALPCLDYGRAGRYLDLHWWERGWRVGWRFLAVHK